MTVQPFAVFVFWGAVALAFGLAAAYALVRRRLAPTSWTAPPGMPPFVRAAVVGSLAILPASAAAPTYVRGLLAMPRTHDAELGWLLAFRLLPVSLLGGLALGAAYHRGLPRVVSWASTGALAGAVIALEIVAVLDNHEPWRHAARMMVAFPVGVIAGAALGTLLLCARKRLARGASHDRA